MNLSGKIFKFAFLKQKECSDHTRAENCALKTLEKR